MRRNQLSVFLHLVWATWDRRPLLHGPLEREVYRAISAKCKELQVKLVALGGVEDHVHLLVLLPPTLTIADLVKHIKGASSHVMAQHILTQTGGFFKWQSAYGAFSVSPQHWQAVADYIRYQREHHADGSLRPEWEIDLTDEAGEGAGG